MITLLRIDHRDPAVGVRLAAALCEDGMITFESSPQRADVLALARQIMTIWPHRDSEPDGITVLQDRGDLAKERGFAGFGHHALGAHTEASAVESPPQLMMLVCAQAATAGGQCSLVDGRELYRELLARDPELLAALSTPRSVLFGGAAGHLGAVFEERAGRTLIRLRMDDLARFSPQIGLRLSDLRELIQELEQTVALQPGSGYLLDNTRWLHGRAAFSGARTMYRILGMPLPSLGIAAGFLAPAPKPTGA